VSTRKAGVNWPILVGGAAIVIPLVVVLASGFGKDPHYIPEATVWDKATEFNLQDLNGNTVRLSDYRGRPVVLNFWSTWCGPCKIEHPVLQREPRNYPDVAFLGAIYSDDPDAARRFLARPRMDLPYPQLVDAQGRVALDFGVSGVPETYFINPNGVIVHKHVAPIDPPTLAACVELARQPAEKPEQVDAKLLAACDPESVR
jgi:cytochrome c biogenesis protein CcmG, thiol:disulfide interchange protein DsbE